MNNKEMTHLRLSGEASPKQLELAAALNHTELFSLTAISLGGEVHKTHELTWTHAGSKGTSIIAFPSLEEYHSGEQLDLIIEHYLRQPPLDAGCWSLDPPQPIDLGIKLLARGFHPGWRPCWMALDLEELKGNYQVPDGLLIKADNTTPVEDVNDLPYASSMDRFILQHDPEHRLQWFVAKMKSEIIAHCSVLLGTEAAGIYHVGVVPKARNRGIGKAIVLNACIYAKQQGYRYAVLNATGRQMYEQIGFKWLNYGFTWWMKTARLLSNPPTKIVVAMAEAIGRGDVDTLQHEIDFNMEDLSKPLTNGMTLMQLAVHCLQPVSAEWLMSHGQVPTVLEAWDLGWKERATELLSDNPEQVNQLYGEWGTTLLHTAAERKDMELARLALSARPDLKIKDKVYKATPLDWAKYSGHEEMISILSEKVKEQE